MFPEYKGYLPKPIGCLDCHDLSDFYLSIRHDGFINHLFCEEFDASVRALTTSYRYFNQELMGILPQLLEGHPLSVTAFPPTQHPSAGRIVKHSPVASYKKLVNIKTNAPTLNGVSALLIQSLRASNDEALFRHIDRLQQAKHPIFYDFLHFLVSGWKLVSTQYADRYDDESLPASSALCDECGYFDSSQFESLFHDEDFLIECVVKLLANPQNPDCTHCDCYDFDLVLNGQNYCFYGFGFELMLNGRVDVLAYLLNDKLHPFDAIFLKFILPAITKSCLNRVESDNVEYFECITSQLETLSQSNYKHHIKPALFASLYQKMMDTYHVVYATGWITVRHQIHFFRKPYRYSAGYQPSPQEVASYERFQHMWGSFKDLADPLLLYVINLMIQVPVGKLMRHKGRLGPLLRTMFPGRTLELLTLPLNEVEERAATLLLTAAEENTLNTSLQVYHLAPLSNFQTFIVNGMHLLMEGFLQVNSKLTSKGRTIYQGGHDVYQLSPLATNAKNGVAGQIEEINTTYQLWNSAFGFRHLYTHSLYWSMNNIPFCHAGLFREPYRLHLTPNTSVLKQEKSGLRFYPLSFGDKGLYCHLNEGSNISVKSADNTQYIASGCCLLGNDFVATVETAEGKKTYHLLDAHEEVPDGAIVDVSFQHQEHPEEAMYLSIQKTLAPFYRVAYKNKKVIFYYHDLRMDYLFYLLPHYIKGTLSRELLLKAVAIINERHQLMVSKLTAILAPYGIECCALSALTSLNLDELLEQVNALKQNTTVDDIESALTSYILQFMASDASVPEHSKQVYAYVLAHKATLEELLQQQGLHFIAIVDYMAQFALINLRAQSPVLVALSCVEYKLLKSYELTFAKVFGSVIHFLWMNPITIRDDKKHNRLFFIDRDIPQFCALIDTATAPLQRMIHHQAVDNPQGVAREWERLKGQLSKFPRFFAAPNTAGNPTTEAKTMENGIV